jgi:hypothetical protein
MMNYKQIIGFIASITGSVDYVREFDELHLKLKRNYSVAELKIYYAILVEKIRSFIVEKETILHVAQSLGTTRMEYKDMLFGNSISKDLSSVIECLKMAEKYFEIKFQDGRENSGVDFDSLPTYISDEQLANVMDWTLSTIATKHSRGELACVKGEKLTPKQGLLEYLEKKTEGMNQDQTEWIKKKIIKKAKKKK